MMQTVIGIDYGTQEARAILVNAEDGEVLSARAVRYPHGVMDGDLASAEDYEGALETLLARVTDAGLRDSVAGICVDATSLTLVPLAADGRVLSRLPGLEAHPQAQIKLWKRHAAQPQAEETLQLARRTRQPFLGRTGGSLSSEWMLPKLVEMRDAAPEVYAKLDLALDLCEFLTGRLTGRFCRSAGPMGYKGLYSADLGLPGDAFLNELRPGLAGEYRRLMRGTVLRPGDAAGRLSESWKRRLGLRQDVVVAAGIIDGHTGPAALGALGRGDAALVVGTSNVLSVQADALCEIEGVCGIVRDGMVPGMYGLEAGQNCTGDMLEWYVRNTVPSEVSEAAERRQISMHEILSGRVREPWRCRITAADWWNGSRNVPCDLSLTGAILGLTLDARPEDIYLALLQGIACGTRELIDQCARGGLPVHRILATGGMALKNPLLMQQYANLLGRSISVGDLAEGPALGAAIYAAVAAGVHPTLEAASRAMGIRQFKTYAPDAAHADAYEQLFRRNHRWREAVRACREEDG